MKKSTSSQRARDSRHTQAWTTRKKARRLRKKITSWSTGLTVTGNGTGVINHAGASVLRLVADTTGLTGRLSQAMGGNKNGRGHDRGRVLIDAAMAMGDGKDTIRRVEVLSAQKGLYADMASRSTVGRVLGGEVDADRLNKIATARAEVREHVWGLAERDGGIPAARVSGGDLGDQVVLRMDANFVCCHSRKEDTAKNRGKFGLFPFNVFIDNTGETVVTTMRPGNSGPNTAQDHIDAVDEAIAQVPAWRRDNLLITADGAGATHDFLDHLSALGAAEGVTLEYSVGWAIDQYVGPVIHGLDESAWNPMLLADGTPGTPASLDEESGPNTVGEVAEITGLIDLSGWPDGIRVFIRRVKPLRDRPAVPLPGVANQLELDGVADTAAAQAAAVTGWRYESFATNTPVTAGHSNVWLDDRHRKHARVEGDIRCGKHTGAAKFPFESFDANTAWFTVHGIADDLLAWMKLLTCHDMPDLAKAEPQTLQDRILHAAANLTRSGRRRKLNFPPDWPWTRHIITIYQRIHALPAPAG